MAIGGGLLAVGGTSGSTVAMTCLILAVVINSAYIRITRGRDDGSIGRMVVKGGGYGAVFFFVILFGFYESRLSWSFLLLLSGIGAIAFGVLVGTL
jgi:hypothetical protein